MYTISEVSKIANVTPKTLYHYHKIGILVPDKIGENNYRYYDQKSIERLQEILFYRSLDMSLDNIKVLLNGDCSRIDTLKQQRMLLKRKKGDIEVMLETVNKSIQAEEDKKYNKTNENSLQNEELFKGLESVDPVDRTIVNFAVIFSKPFAIVFTATFVYGVFRGLRMLVDVGDVSGTFIETMSPVGIKVYLIIIITLFILGIVINLRFIFGKKTSEYLKEINNKYFKPKK